MKYRPEIDGLRAIALIPVMMFHAGFSTFSGGFIGVDVFFVISGYLITSIILSELGKGTFTLANFYERRARRILPALFLVMLVSLPFSWFLLLPNAMKGFSQSLVAVSTFSSNILFLLESGYWDTVSSLKPLLHTWSLAVEGQFYILFPIFLVVIWRFRKKWILSSFILIAAVSLSLAQWGAYHKPSATFYLLPTRGWELAIGAGIAYCSLNREQLIQKLLSNKLANEVFGLFGLILIGYSVYLFDEKTPFPSLYTLIPTVGTGLIILFSSSKTVIGRILSTKLIVGIGLISYSAYLWHQPLLAFARHASLSSPSDLIYAGLIFLSFPLAYFSYRFVEKPFKNKDVVTRKSIIIFSLVGLLLFSAIGLVGYTTGGFSFRSNGQLTAGMIDKKLEVNHGLSNTCDDVFTLSSNCRTDNEPEILVWGDSYAMHLVHGILASNTDAKIIQMTKSGCGPFFDIAPISQKGLEWGKGCLDFTNEVRHWIKENNTLKYIVLSSSFSEFLSTEQQFLQRNGETLPATYERVSIEFENTLQELQQQGITPVVFSPPPANGLNMGDCLAKAEWRGLNLNNCDFSVESISPKVLNVYKFLESIDTQYTVVRLDEKICNEFRCTTHIDQTYMYRDQGHLSQEGSAMLGKTHAFYQLITDK